MEDHNTRILVVGRDKGEARYVAEALARRPSTTSPISPEIFAAARKALAEP